MYKTKMLEKVTIFLLFKLVSSSMNVEMSKIGDASHYNHYKTEGNHQIQDKEKLANASAMELSCYECNSIHDGDLCYNINSNNTNLAEYSHKIKKCPSHQPYCKVYRVEYLLLEDFMSSDDGPYTAWSLERNCSDECKNFCVTMGGRTKLTYCTSCCTSNLCNIDNSSTTSKLSNVMPGLLFFALFYALKNE